MIYETGPYTEDDLDVLMYGDHTLEELVEMLCRPEESIRNTAARYRVSLRGQKESIASITDEIVEALQTYKIRTKDFAFLFDVPFDTIVDIELSHDIMRDYRDPYSTFNRDDFLLTDEEDAIMRLSCLTLHEKSVIVRALTDRKRVDKITLLLRYPSKPTAILLARSKNKVLAQRYTYDMVGV